jgi:hypothetical protein
MFSHFAATEFPQGALKVRSRIAAAQMDCPEDSR